MHKKVFLSSIFLVFAISCSAQSRNSFIYDPQSGMNLAAENFNAGFHIFDYLDSLYIPKKLSKEEHGSAKFVNPLFRFGKLFLTNYLLTDYAMTMNHEKYGHGYRVREAGGIVVEIVYNPPPPFSNEFSYIGWLPNSDQTPQQDMALRFGGSETNLVLSDVIRKNVLLEEQFSYNYTLAYLYSSNDAPGYAAFVSNPNADPIRYREELNDFYSSSTLTKEKVRTYSLIALLTDPLNFYALKSVFYDYLILGKHSTRVGMIKLSNRIKYLPRFRFENTPYGIELVLHNYVKINKKLIQFNFSHSDGIFEPAWRLLTNLWNLKKRDNFTFNLSGQFWQQPAIDYYKNDVINRSQGSGGQVVINTNYDFISKDYILGATLHLGYKTSGYSLGEQLDEGLIIRGGVTFKLGNKS